MTLAPLYSLSLPVIAFGLVLLTGLVLLVRGIRGEAELSHPTCAKCRYDLRGRDLTSVASCPECGKSLNTPRAVRFGKYRRKPRLMIIGATMAIAPIALVLMLSENRVRRRAIPPTTALHSHSTTQIIQELFQKNSLCPSSFWTELSARLADGRLTHEQIVAVIDQLIANVKVRPGESLDTWDSPFLQRAMVTNHVDQDQLIRLCDAYYNIPPQVQMRQKLRAGCATGFSIGTVMRASWGVELFSCITAIKVDDRSLRMTDRHRKEQTNLSSACVTGPCGEVQIDVEPGEHVLNFEMEFGIVDAKLVTVTARQSPGPPEGWPTTLNRWKYVVSVPITVVPWDGALIELIDDPALEQSLRNSIRIPQVRVTRTERGETGFKVDYWAAKETPVPICFDVFISCGEREVRIGRFWRGTQMRNRGEMRKMIQDEVPVSLDKVRVILRPNVEEMESSLDGDRIWGRELVYDDVPLVRAPET